MAESEKRASVKAGVIGVPLCSASRCALSLMLLLFLQFALPARAQVLVAPCTDWLATVDEATQQIVLSWRPSADASAMGYHICTGTPCLDYDTVFGRLDTSYRCLDHSPDERHTYRLHVFDSAFNVSALTPPFGNMVLEVSAPPCSPTVGVWWSPYEGMPGGVDRYCLMVRSEPADATFVPFRTYGPSGPWGGSFDVADSVTRIAFKVMAFSRDSAEGPLVSQSNIVIVDRLTADTARFLRLLSVEHDSTTCRNLLAYSVDTAFHRQPYVLWRSIDGSPWDSLAMLDPASATFVDAAVNPYDSVYCYRLSVRDACGLNPRFSDERCVVVPDPPPARWVIPNALVAGSDDNGNFLPRLQGFKGDLYELHVYNRMGLLVFATTDPAEPWVPQADTPQGVYTYTLRVRFVDNRIRTLTGTVLVIR